MIPTAFLPLLLLWACSTVSGPSDLKPVAGHLDEAQVERSRWVGIGSYDACGLSWGLDLHQEGNRVTGKLLWETVRYDLKATLTDDGNLNARARKNSALDGIFPAPRFVLVSLVFGETRATGSYAAETKGPNNCATAVDLKRYAADVAPVSFVSSNEEKSPEPEQTSH
jgi:hypothetical protein